MPESSDEKWPFYLAHVGIGLDCDYTSYPKNEWITYKKAKTIEVRWRLRDDLVYEVVAGPFSDKSRALQIAKITYVTVLINCLFKRIPVFSTGLSFYEHRPFIPEHEPYASTLEEFRETEAFFFWNPNFRGDELGPGVYAIPSPSIDEITLYNSMHYYKKNDARMSDDAKDLDFSNLDGIYFCYSRDVRTTFIDLFEAENSYDQGYIATKYCGILEHLYEKQNQEKEREVVEFYRPPY